MGAADVVPGVSGGTMALALGIYARLIDAIRSFDRLWLRAVLLLDVNTMIARPRFGFLLPVGAGVFCALLFFTRVVPLPTLIVDHPEEIYSLFFGLIGGSVIVLRVEIGAVDWRNGLSLAGGLLFGLFVFNLIPVATPNAAWFVFLSGALSICAMILPGVSGSFVLLILNKYSEVLHAIGHFHWPVLLPFALGAATGLILASRALSWLLHRCYRPTLFCIVGLLLASLTVIWPYQQRSYMVVRGKARLIESAPILPPTIDLQVALHGLIMLFGFALVVALGRMGARETREMREPT